MSKKQDEIKKQKAKENKIIKQNQEILNDIVKTKQQRHVKVQDEPIFSNILKDFRVSYAKTVVMNSANEILKYVRDEV